MSHEQFILLLDLTGLALRARGERVVPLYYIYGERQLALPIAHASQKPRHH